MARKPRIEFEGAFYHVITRGNQRQIIFRDDDDFGKYLEVLARYKKPHKYRLYAYALTGQGSLFFVRPLYKGQDTLLLELDRNDNKFRGAMYWMNSANGPITKRCVFDSGILCQRKTGGRGVVGVSDINR
jgi:hypothetical protein